MMYMKANFWLKLAQWLIILAQFEEDKNVEGLQTDMQTDG